MPETPTPANTSGRPAHLVLADLVNVDTALQKATAELNGLQDDPGVRDSETQVARLRQRKVTAARAEEVHAEELRRMNQDAAKLRARRRDNVKGLSADVDVERRRDLTHDLTVTDRRLAEVEEAIDGHEKASDADSLQDAAAQLDGAVAALETARQENRGRQEELDRDITSLTEHSTALRAELPAPLLRRYERSEGEHGVGAAVLAGSSCGACFMTLDQASLSEILRAPKDDPETCPECDTMLLPEATAYDEFQG